MGIKFKDKTSAGVPSAGDIAEREIHLDTKNKDIYTSSNGTDIIKLARTDNAVTSSNSAGTGEVRVPEIVKMTQVDYDALGTGRPNKLYIIVN
jgi:hypothetical protein